MQTDGREKMSSEARQMVQAGGRTAAGTHLRGGKKASDGRHLSLALAHATAGEVVHVTDLALGIQHLQPATKKARSRATCCMTVFLRLFSTFPLLPQVLVKEWVFTWHIANALHACQQNCPESHKSKSVSTLLAVVAACSP